MSGTLPAGSTEARLVYRLMDGERLVTHPPARDEDFVGVTAAVVHRLMSLHPSPLVVWMAGQHQTSTELADQLAAAFERLGEPPRLRPHDQATLSLRYAGDEGHVSADHIPLVESRDLPQQTTISDLLIVNLAHGPLPEAIPEHCLTQVLGWGTATRDVRSFLHRRFTAALPTTTRRPDPNRPWGDIPTSIVLAGAPE